MFYSIIKANNMYTYVSNGVKHTVYQEQDVQSNAYNEKIIKKAIQNYKDNLHMNNTITCRLALKIIRMLGCSAQGDCAAIRYMDAGMVTNWPIIMKDIMNIYSDELDKINKKNYDQRQLEYMLRCDYYTYIKPINEKIQELNILINETPDITCLPTDII